TYILPDRNRAHVGRLLHLLTDAGNLAPATCQMEPDRLLSLASAFAEEVYPELLRPERNSMPFWVYWMAGFPGHWKRPVSLMRYLHRRKLDILKFAFVPLPLALLILNLVLSFLLTPANRAPFLLASSAVSMFFVVVAVALAVFAIAF